VSSPVFKMWRDVLLKTIYFCIFLQEKLRYILAVAVYPLYKRAVIKWAKTFYDIEFVSGPPKKWNEFGIVKNERKAFLRFAPNFAYGLAENLRYGDLIVQNFPELHKRIRDRNLSMFKDSHHVLSQMVNLQKGNLAWNVASHYNTGTTLFFSSLGEY